MNKQIEIDAITSKITSRELTAEEVSQREADRIALMSEQETKDAAATAKAIVKAALLERLGITEDEAELLK